LQSDGACGRFYISQRSLGNRSIGRIDEHGDTSRARHHLTQEFQPLCGQLTTENIDPCQVAARPGEAGDKTEPDRVFGDNEDDRSRRGCWLGSDRRWLCARGDYGDLSANELATGRLTVQLQ
jgi:hypothetical protein